MMLDKATYVVRTMRVVLCAASMFWIAHPANAATVDLQNCALVVSGDIDAKTPGQVMKELPRPDPDNCPTVMVKFHSGGGDLQAALKLGEQLRAAKVMTVVPSDASCASSCVLSFVGGSFGGPSGA